MKGSSHTTLTTGNIGIPKFDLTGKIALITGVGSEIGIGRAIARTYAWYGEDLVIADINEEKIKERAEEISKESGRRIVPVRCDVCNGALLRWFLLCELGPRPARVRSKRSSAPKTRSRSPA